MRRLLIALPLLVLSSCSDDAEQLGVTLADGRPAAVSAPCEGMNVSLVELIRTEGSDNPGDTDDIVLWKAVAPSPQPSAFITPIGEAPDGFETAIPLEVELEEVREYTLYVEWFEGGAGVVIFRPQELRAGWIESERGPFTLEQFIDYADGDGSGCDLVDGTEAMIRTLE